MSGCRRYKKLMSLYVDGILPERTTASFLAHIKECPECAAELENLKNLIGELNTLPQLVLEPDFHNSTMSFVFNDGANHSAHRIPVFQSAARFGGVLAAAMVMLIVLSVGITGINALFSSKDAALEIGIAEINMAADTSSVGNSTYSIPQNEPPAIAARSFSIAQATPQLPGSEKTQYDVDDVKEGIQQDQSILLLGDTYETTNFSGLARNHYITIETDDLEAALMFIKTLSGFEQYSYYGSSSASITRVVPQTDYAGFTVSLAAIGVITSESMNTYSVSDDMADAYYRLTSKRSEYEHLLELMKMSDTVPDMLMIEARMESVASQTDYYASRYNTLAYSAANATVYITINKKEPDDIIVSGLSERILENFERSVRAVYETSETVIVFAAGAAVPTALTVILAISAWFIYKKIREGRRRE